MQSRCNILFHAKAQSKRKGAKKYRSSASLRRTDRNLKITTIAPLRETFFASSLRET